MGRRSNRKKPTRKERVKGQRPEVRGRRSEIERSEDPREKRKRKMSPETQELVAAYAKVMGWTPEKVLSQCDEVGA